MTIGERIKLYRKQAHMTQKQLAEKVDIAEITVRKYEGGACEPKSYIARRIAEVLGVSFSDLMGWDEYEDVNKRAYDRIVENVRFYKDVSESGGLVRELNFAFLKLNATGQQKAVDYVNDLIQINAYTKIEKNTEKDN